MLADQLLCYIEALQQVSTEVYTADLYSMPARLNLFALPCHHPRLLPAFRQEKKKKKILHLFAPLNEKPCNILGCSDKEGGSVRRTAGV